MRAYITVIANKSAGKGDATEKGIRSFLSMPPHTLLKFRTPGTAREMREICDELDPTECKGLFIVGGDGTLNKTLNSIADRGIPVGIIPGGTANDLAAEIGISGNPEQLKELLHTESIAPIDLISVNGSMFATVGGIGICSVLTKEFNRWRRRSRFYRFFARYLGSSIYTLLAIKTILLRRDYIREVIIRSPEYNDKIKTTGIFVCNQQTLGGRYDVAKNAKNDDGKFEVVILTEACQYRLFRALLYFRMGYLPPNTITFSTNQLMIQDTDGRDLLAFGDGESVISSDKLDFSIRPKALHVYRPLNTRISPLPASTRTRMPVSS